MTGRNRDKGAFKTPTLRDLDRKKFFFHDGSANSLKKVVEIYNKGGLHRNGIDVEIRPLGLTAKERSDLVKFLNALKGKTRPGK